MWQGSASITSMITSAMRHGAGATHIVCWQYAAKCMPILKFT